MSVFVALFRGVNVGGNNALPMKQLANALGEIGLLDVRTYIQSGNAVFRCKNTNTAAAQLMKQIGQCVSDRFGFAPGVLVLDKKELEQAAAENPFPAADSSPKSLHLFFLESAPESCDLLGMNQIKAPDEQLVLKGRTLYLYTPSGFGVSKLAQRAERLLGVPATARNWRTVCAVLALAKELG